MNKDKKESISSSENEQIAQSEVDNRHIIRVPHGLFSRGINVITSTSQNLVVVLGKSELEQVVLVPYVEMGYQIKVAFKEDAPKETNFATISVENASFVISDVCSDFLRISQEIEKICSERCGLDRMSAEYIIDCLFSASAALEESISTFKNMTYPDKPLIDSE